MELDFATVMQAAAGIGCASLVSAADRNHRTSGIVKLLAGGIGGIGGGMAIAPLISDLLTSPSLVGYSAILGNLLGGALGGGALTVLVGATIGGTRR